MSSLSQVNIDGSVYNIQGHFYGTCSTAMGTAAKAIVCSEFSSTDLEAGSMITILFSNPNTAESPTLNINSTGAKNIYYKGNLITNGEELKLLCGLCIFIYDGTQFHLISSSLGTLTGTVTSTGTYTILSLGISS